MRPHAKHHDATCRKRDERQRKKMVADRIAAQRALRLEGS
jgi:hypothetical protein